jgi:hypothetical protein
VGWFVSARRPIALPESSPRRREFSTELRDKSHSEPKLEERPWRGGCAQPARTVRWRMADGTLAYGRCQAPNRCDNCAQLAALETAMMLKLDAGELGSPPSVGLTTTTHRPDFSMAELREATRKLMQHLRRHAERRGWDRVEYAAQLEFTTGLGTHSGGHRRPHLHHLIKGIPAECSEELEPELRRAWKVYEGSADQVSCKPLRTVAGAIHYMGLHNSKRCQAPPAGFEGRRFRASRGYFEKPAKELRALARKLVARDRTVASVLTAIDIELYGAEPRIAEWQCDRQLTRAIVAGLRDLAEKPLPLQRELALPVELARPSPQPDRARMKLKRRKGAEPIAELEKIRDSDRRSSHDKERAELEIRTLAELERIRREEPPELVRVLETPVLGSDGELRYRVRAVIGPVRSRAA